MPFAAVNGAPPPYPVIDKGGFVYDARAYGLVGDGREEGAAINTFLGIISTAGGGTAYFAPGTWGSASIITVPANVSILGAGQALTIFAQANAANIDHLFLIAGTGGQRLLNFTINGNKANQTGGEGRGIEIDAAAGGNYLLQQLTIHDCYGHGIIVAGSNVTPPDIANSTFCDIYAYNNRGKAAFFQYLVNFAIERCVWEIPVTALANADDDAIMVQNCTLFTYSACRTKNPSIVAAVGHTKFVSCSDAVLTAVEVYGCPDDGIDIGSCTNLALNSPVVDAQSGVGPCITIWGTGTQQVTVTNPTVQNCSTEGIYCDGFSEGSIADIAINGGIVYGCTNGILIDTGVSANTIRNVLVSSVFLINNTTGINIGNNSDFVTAQGLKFISNGTNISNGASGTHNEIELVTATQVQAAQFLLTQGGNTRFVMVGGGQDGIQLSDGVGTGRLFMYDGAGDYQFEMYHANTVEVNMTTTAAALFNLGINLGAAKVLLATGAGHTVDDVITALQTAGICRQS